jgi:cell filamentation protein
MNSAFKNRIAWRWAERDFGFRFQQGKGKSAADYYQAAQPAEFYHVPTTQRKLTKARLEELAAPAKAPTAPTIVAIPWKNYSDSDLQMIAEPGGICLNWAGCLSQDEVNSRETNGVNRAKEFVADLAVRSEPAPITLDLIQRIHTEMFGDIYPWAGKWRSVTLAKGDVTWTLPRYGWEPVFAEFERDVLALTPFLNADDRAVCEFVARLMGEYIALHPFREGNGRSAFILSDLVLLQNGLVPLDAYIQKRDRDRYFAACETARLNKNYTPLADLIIEWETAAQEKYDRGGSGEDFDRG